MTQSLDLERELYGSVSELQILRFQSLKQVLPLTPFSPVVIRSRTGPADPRKLGNGS